MNSQIQSIFDSLWTDYIEFNPQAKRIYDVILAHEKTSALVNDHVALRTFDHPKIGIQALAKHFTALGYKDGGQEYIFKEKKLYARHFEHADKTLPKVFISELQTGKCSKLVQETAAKVADEIDSALVAKPSFLWSRRTWKASHATYQELLKESEYAAWMYAFGFRSNHFTISVNHLKTFKSLQDLNAFIESNGFKLNSSGGVVKGTPEQLLEQSSTLAEKTSVQFDDGRFDIPACYYEFARRYPNARGELYQGFIAASADKIFESTDVKQNR